MNNSTHSPRHSPARPRLDEDAVKLLSEAAVRFDALESAAASAILDGSYENLLAAAEAVIMLSVAGRKFVAFATHYAGIAA